LKHPAITETGGLSDARRSHGADLNLDNGLTRTASLVKRLPAKIRIALNGDQNQIHPAKIRSVEFQVTVQACSPAELTLYNERLAFSTISCGKPRLERLIFSLVENTLFPPT
jgi:hypothetical protein